MTRQSTCVVTSVAIFSDETFYTQSQIMVEKVPEFSAESLCLRQGMVTYKWPLVSHSVSHVVSHGRSVAMLSIILNGDLIRGPTVTV